MMSDTFYRLDTTSQTVVFRVRDNALPEAIYWGVRLADGDDLPALAASQQMDLSGGMLDKQLPLSVCPAQSAPFPGQPGLSLSDGNTRLYPTFCVNAVEESTTALSFDCRDNTLGISYRAQFRVKGDVLIARATISSDKAITCHWLAAPVLPAPQLSDEILDWHGTWLREYHRQSTPWSHGIRLREARTGRSGHEHPPIAAIPSRGATRTAGVVHALQFAWSGGHRFIAEELPDGRRQLQMGKAWDSEAVNHHFDSGELLLAVSDVGEAGIASAFQRYIRDQLVPWADPKRARPVHYNCWEAIYFEHSFDTLAQIAEQAAELGAERFVLDDGWFGQRDDDTSSLGDWFIDRRKWPDGLTPLIDKVQSLGMTFGLWVEPEMVNQNSALYRAHPEWLLGDPEQVTGRFQHVLDLALPAVRDYLFDALDALLNSHDIDYLKWDHNRLLPVVDARQTEGVYQLLSRLRHAHPRVEIESCASGGGRIDAGILAYTHRVWLSDSNDAIERLRMQHEAALFLPPAITGSHVGARTSHSSGRILPMPFRGWVAAQRHLGFEMDPRDLTHEEISVLKRITAWWKATRDWRMNGITIPLESCDEAVTAEIQLAADGQRFVLFCGIGQTPNQSLPRPQMLAGLVPEARYRLQLINPEDKPPQSRGQPALLAGPLELSGRMLMTAGLQLPVSWPATMWVIEGERIA